MSSHLLLGCRLPKYDLQIYKVIMNFTCANIKMRYAPPHNHYYLRTIRFRFFLPSDRVELVCQMCVRVYVIDVIFRP